MFYDLPKKMFDLLRVFKIDGDIKHMNHFFIIMKPIFLFLVSRRSVYML